MGLPPHAHITCREQTSICIPYRDLPDRAGDVLLRKETEEILEIVGLISGEPLRMRMKEFFPLGVDRDASDPYLEILIIICSRVGYSFLGAYKCL